MPQRLRVTGETSPSIQQSRSGIVRYFACSIQQSWNTPAFWRKLLLVITLVIILAVIVLGAIIGTILLKIVRRWMRIRHAKREIALLVGLRVASVRVFSTPGASLMNLGRMTFIIATNTDEEAEALRKDYPRLYSQLCEAMTQIGYSSPDVQFHVESQETVDREFGGSWNQAVWG